MEFKTTTNPVIKKPSRALAAAVLTAGLMLTGPKPAKADSVEVMAGHKSTVMDIKAAADITPKLSVFGRVRPSIDHHGTIESFGLADLCIKLHGGLDAVAEIQAFEGKAVPRAGLQYFINSGDISFFTAANIGMDAKPYLESDMELRFTPVLRGELRLLSQLENLSDLDADGNIFSTQRLRLGAGWKGWGAGAAADFIELGHAPESSDGTLTYNIGAFVSKRF